MANATAKQKVLITGVSGFLGSHVAMKFLKNGTYQVVGTVRSVSNEAKIAPLRKAFGDLFKNLTLVEADLTDKTSIMKAAKGCDFIVHTASPLPIKAPKDENEIIRPAVDGTLAVMEACLAYKIKRVVITSSSCVIENPAQMPEDRVFTEEMFSEPEGQQPYMKSKTLAEKAAWDFQKAHAKEHMIEIATINPVFVLGPAFVGAGFGSGDVIANILLKKWPALPKLYTGIVDVRDCAEMHLQALIRPEAANKRFIACGDHLWFHDIGQILKEKWGPQGYNPVTCDMPKPICQGLSLFLTEMKLALRMWGQKDHFSNEQSRKILGMKYEIPAADTINDMVLSMIETGALPDKRPKA